jgi:hypothetical protein
MKPVFLAFGALFALILLFALYWRSEERLAIDVVNKPRGSSFAVRVMKSPLDRPLLGLFPEKWLKRMDPSPGELSFDHSNPGASGSVGPSRLELHAEGWHLLLELDRDGRVTPETALVLPMNHAGRRQALHCRPSRQVGADLRTTPAEVPGAFDGAFRFRLSACEVAATGEAIDWPVAPMTAMGSFTALPAVSTGGAAPPSSASATETCRSSRPSDHS